MTLPLGTKVIVATLLSLLSKLSSSIKNVTLLKNTVTWLEEVVASDDPALDTIQKIVNKLNANTAKLNNIEENATADQTPQEIVTAINSHIGNTEWQSQRSLEYIQDAVAAMLQLGNHTNISVNYDDATGAISLTGSGDSLHRTDE